MQTLVIIKPDGVYRGLMGEVIKRYEQRGLKITYMNLIKAERPLVEKHYEQHRGKPFYNKLIEYMTSGLVLTMIIEGDDAVELVRKLNGATKVEEAAPGTIRGDFASSTTYNIVHSSDSAETAEREIALWTR